MEGQSNYEFLKYTREKKMKIKKLMVLLRSCSVVLGGSFTTVYAAQEVGIKNN